MVALVEASGAQWSGWQPNQVKNLQCAKKFSHRVVGEPQMEKGEHGMPPCGKEEMEMH